MIVWRPISGTPASLGKTARAAKFGGTAGTTRRAVPTLAVMFLHIFIPLFKL